MPHLFPAFIPLAELATMAPAPAPPHPVAARELAALLAGLTLLLVIFLLVVLMLLLRRRAQAQTRRRGPPDGPPRSAWAEAGRRTPRPDPDDDDTIDYDPRDLSPDDVKPKGPDAGHRN